MLSVSDLSSILDGVAVAVIGPVTRRAAESWRLNVAIEPAESSIPALIEAIDRFYRTQARSS